VDYVNLGVPQPRARSRRSRAETPWRWERDGEQDDGGQLDVHPAEHIEHPSQHQRADTGASDKLVGTREIRTVMQQPSA